jgi:2-polyprenyl-3-methyl-5-hydroxy-6-metoxy-1,4-benzoquinol methylase
VERSVLEPIDYYAGAQASAVVPERQLVAVDLLRPSLRSAAGRILDAGCGDGLFLGELDRAGSLCARGWELYGMDYSSAMISEARKRPYVFRECNLEQGIPEADGSFDIVTASEVIEHIYDPDQLISEAHRVLRPGGLLLITTPNLQAWYNRALFAAGIQPLFYETSTRSTHIGAGAIKPLKRGSTPVGHLRLFNRRALLDLLESQGFRVLAVRAAVFESLPGLLQRIDRVFNRRPSLASNLVVLASR